MRQPGVFLRVTACFAADRAHTSAAEADCVCRCVEVSSSSSWCRARGSSRTWRPPACWLRCSACRRLGRLITLRAESAEAKRRTAQVRELLLRGRAGPSQSSLPSRREKTPLHDASEVFLAGISIPIMPCGAVTSEKSNYRVFTLSNVCCPHCVDGQESV